MKHLFHFCMAIGWGCAAMAQPTPGSDCGRYHKGQFSYTDSAGNVVMVKRTKNKQIEINSATNLIIKLRIRWTGDCTYELKQIWSNSRAQRKYNGSITGVVISQTLGDRGYEYTCACKGENAKKIAGVMRRE